MSIKILEQNGIENENMDGGALNNFAAGGRDGIMRGVLNECAVTRISSNVLGLESGELMIHGIRVKLTESQSFVLSSAPANPIRYQLIADVSVSANKAVTCTILLQTVGTLIRDELYKNEAGRYQAEIAQFTHATDGSIAGIVRTMEVITGGSDAVESFEVGTVTTLPAGAPATVNNSGTNKNIVLDFGIPQGVEGKSLYGFSVIDGKLIVTSAVANEHNVMLSNGHLVFQI